VQLVISDAHTGLKTAIGKVFGCRWQRCTVHCLRDMLGHVARTQQPLVWGAIRGIFTAGSAVEARQRLGQVVDQLRPMRPRSLACWRTPRSSCWPSPPSHRALVQVALDQPLERVNREIGRRSDVVGIVPNDAALPRLAGILLLEQNDEWLVGRCYLSETSMTLVLASAMAQDRPTDLKKAPSSPDHDTVWN
jgi:putative transposase